MSSSEEADKQVAMWKVKKLIKSLSAARGNGTSMISLIIPPGDQISRVNRMLVGELGTASNIKSRTNRLSVLSAITSTQQKLRLFNKVPPNGLVVYCGTVLTDDNKEKKVTIDFEPFKPINTSLYLCDNRFHTEALSELLEEDDKFGFIVIDGNGTLYGTLCGSTRAILHKFSVDLPKKHGRGGQSALRFGRLRLEKRHNYLRKVAEAAVQFFITDDRSNVAGLILAGSASFKTELQKSDLFDARLKKVVLKTVDVSYGGENGFNQAIENSSDILSHVKFVKEKRLLSAFFNEIAKDTGKCCFGIRDTMRALEMGAAETAVVWESLDIIRYAVRNPSTGEISTLYLSPEQSRDPTHFVDKETFVELEVVDKTLMLEWLAENYQQFGTQLELVTNCSQEGSQFCMGFGGVGCLLRWKVEFEVFEFDDYGEDDEFDEDIDFM